MVYVIGINLQHCTEALIIESSAVQGPIPVLICALRRRSVYLQEEKIVSRMCLSKVMLFSVVIEKDSIAAIAAIGVGQQCELFSWDVRIIQKTHQAHAPLHIQKNLVTSNDAG